MDSKESLAEEVPVWDDHTSDRINETSRRAGNHADWRNVTLKRKLGTEQYEFLKGEGNLMKKLVAMILAIMMIAMVGVAWATNNGDVYQDDSLTAVNTTTNKIPMTKSIIMFNINGSDVYEPNISYTYSVAPVTSGSLLGKITDDGELNVVSGTPTPVTVQVNAGVTDGVFFSGTDNTITFSSSNTIVSTEANGVAVKKSTNLSVDLSKFSHAGVYRYKITETDNSATVTAVGMVRGADYSRERYLDVYIKNSTSTPGTLELYGAVIFKVDAQDTSSPANTAWTIWPRTC